MPDETSLIQVLVVEDEQVVRRMLVDFLLEMSYQVLEAGNGREALTLLHHGQHPDVIMTDYDMPELNGADFYRALRSDPKFDSIPVIFLSAMGDTPRIVDCLESGAEDYLTKPCRFEVLEAKLKNVVAKSRRFRELYGDQVKTSRILSKLLPEAAIAEIKNSQELAARKVENVAVLFCDVVGFTAYCSCHDPESVHEKLNDLFRSFDRIAEQHHVARIKTIGDAYMMAVGLQAPHTEPALPGILAALDMIGVSRAQAGWEIRVGLAVGTVIAGLAGADNYQYDIWGDTVNVASRMSDLGPPGVVAVSQEVWRRVENQFAGGLLGAFEIKGKNLQDIYGIQGLLKGGVRDKHSGC